MLNGCTRMGRKMQTGPPKSGNTGSSGFGALGVKLSCRSGGAASAPSRVLHEEHIARQQRGVGNLHLGAVDDGKLHMILQVLPDARQVGDHVDAEASQIDWRRQYPKAAAAWATATRRR